MPRARYSDEDYDYYTDSMSYSPRRGGRGRGGRGGRPGSRRDISDSYSPPPLKGRGGGKGGTGKRSGRDPTEESEEGFWAGAASALGFGGSKPKRKPDKYGDSNQLDKSTRGDREDFTWGNVFSLGGNASDSDTSSGDDRRAWRFPSRSELKAQLLNDEEIQTRAPWVRKMVVDNVLQVFAGKTFTRKVAKKRMNKRIEQLKADPENADLYNDQPYLVRKAIDAGIPSVRNVILEKVWAMGHPTNDMGMSSDEEDALLTARSRRKLERKDDIRAKIDGELIPACRKKISRVVGWDVDILVDWDSFGAGPDAFDGIGGRGGALVFEILYKEFREVFDTTPGKVICPIEVVTIRNGAPTEVLDRHGMLTISSPFHDIEAHHTHILALSSIRHAITAASMHQFHELDVESYGRLVKMVHDACTMPQIESGSLKYLDWLISHPCFWCPPSKYGNIAIELGEREVPNNERIIKSWIALKVSARDREAERVVIVTTMAVYVLKVVVNSNGQARLVRRPADKERLDLRYVHTISVAPFRAKGSFALGARQALYQSQYGVRLEMSPGYARTALILRGHPPPLAAPRSPSAQGKNARAAEKAHAYEMAYLISVARRLATDFQAPFDVETDGAIMRTAKFGSGWTAASYNKSYSGNDVHKR